ncbi:MAG: Ig-like domain-containing protein [Rhodothermales bacterium]
MSFLRPIASFLSLILTLVLASCANPRVPPGGPPDRTPPALEQTEPEAGAVNVTASSVRLVFTEYVDQASFTRALSITPAIDEQLDVKWRGRRVEIRFPGTLRENTTYVFTLDTNLRDIHNIALKQPLTFAFSTGPEINKGQLAGRVLDGLQSSGVASLDVFAYAVPDSTLPLTLPERPDYRTQTDESGRFQFSYLNEQPYFVIALQDRNRNRRADAAEVFAVPSRPAIPADTTRTGHPMPWLTTRHDTLPPVLERVRTPSNRRLALRFSEAVHLTSLAPDGWLLEDSLANRPVAVHAAYSSPDAPRQVFLLADAMADAPHRLRPTAVADSSGNPVRSDTLRFTPAAVADTLRLRFIGFTPDNLTPNETGAHVLPPSDLPGVRFNQPVDKARLARIVAVQDTTQQPLTFIPTSRDGTTYHLSPTPSLRPGQIIQVRVDGRELGRVDTVYTRLFQRISDRELGSLSGAAVADDTSGTLVVELYVTNDQAAPRLYASTRPDSTGRFLFEGLPEGTYRFRIFVDRNGNGRWDGGRILPYQPPEPATWNTEPASWRARWENALEDTLRIPSNV